MYDSIEDSSCVICILLVILPQLITKSMIIVKNNLQ